MTIQGSDKVVEVNVPIISVAVRCSVESLMSSLCNRANTPHGILSALCYSWDAADDFVLAADIAKKHLGDDWANVAKVTLKMPVLLDSLLEISSVIDHFSEDDSKRKEVTKGLYHLLLESLLPILGGK